MWQYSKKLEYPVKIKRANPAMAKLIISQLGGPYINKLYNSVKEKLNRVIGPIENDFFTN